MYEVDICVFNGEEQPTCTSLDVAQTFNRKHYNVLQGIDRLSVEDPAFYRLNFQAIKYADPHGREQPMYVMTRDGFTILAMGFTGKKAREFKKAYIAKFNAMEKELNDRKLADVQRQATRQMGILARRTLTDEIRDSGENERMHGHGYSTYTNLVHKSAVGESLKDTRKRLGLSKKDSVRDRLSAPELESLDAVEKLTASLIACGFQYDQVKQILAARANLPQKKGT